MPNSLTPIILAGGSGTRLWPASRKAKPKQFLNLINDRYSLFQETILRLSYFSNLCPPIIVCNADHRFIVAEQLQELSINNYQIILEPCSRNTAPAITLAALFSDDNSHLLVLPSDHYIEDLDEFSSAVSKASELASSGYLTTFGLKPDFPETGYGYLQKGKPLLDVGFAIDCFVEKPPLEKAKEFLTQSDYFWNSGMFCFNKSRLLQEIQNHCPDIYSACSKSVEHSVKDFDFIRVDNDFFSMSPSQSIDYAIMEKTQYAAMVTFDPSWSDIGAWDALWKKSHQDEQNNAYLGDVILQDTSNCLVHANSRLVTTIGVKDIIIIETADAILVANKNNAQEIKTLVSILEHNERKELHEHNKVYRPWGWYESLCSGHRFQVKRILVKPQASLSLQKHKFRAEHWVVVKGVAEVTNGESVVNYHEDQSTYIPLGNIHRLRNPGDENLEIIEIQTGSYLGEDDIERIDDHYGRN